MFGKDYKFTATVKNSTDLSDSEKDAYIKEYKERITPVAALGEAKAEKFGLKDTDKKHTPKSDMVVHLKILTVQRTSAQLQSAT